MSSKVIGETVMRPLKPGAPRSRMLVALALAALAPAAIVAVVPTIAPTPVLVPVDINVSTGDQFDPHVSGDWVAYTSDVGIRYYNFATNVDAAIPFGSSVNDLLSDISGSKIVFSRVTVNNGTAVMVFDAATPAVPPVEIDVVPNPNRFGAAIGGNTVAYIDFGLESHGELVAHDLTTSISARLTNDAFVDGNPQVSPDGNVVVWEHCVTSITDCDIWQAVKTGAVWSVSQVASTPSPEGNPDTNGTLVVFDSHRVAGSANIFWRPVNGGPEVQLEMPGYQGNPSIAGNVIAFESRASVVDAADIFVYDLVTNRLFQITNTPLVNEQLNDITVLPDGSIRVVWSSDEDGADQRNIKGATFQLPHPPLTLALHLPPSIIVNATSPSGAVVPYVATATDAVDPNPVVDCAPPSGSSFSIRTTVVTCTAMNMFGDQVTGSFNVVVKGAPDQISDLIALVQSFHLRPAVSLTLEGELWIARALTLSSRPGDPLRACGWLNLFINEVRAQTGRAITPFQAAQLLARANQIKAVLGCV
jgi:hypothetical protein